MCNYFGLTINWFGELREDDMWWAPTACCTEKNCESVTIPSFSEYPKETRHHLWRTDGKATVQVTLQSVCSDKTSLWSHWAPSCSRHGPEPDHNQRSGMLDERRLIRSFQSLTESRHEPESKHDWCLHFTSIQCVKWISPDNFVQLRNPTLTCSSFGFLSSDCTAFQHQKHDNEFTMKLWAWKINSGGFVEQREGLNLVEMSVWGQTQSSV